MINRKIRGSAIALAIGLFGWLAPAEAWAACTGSDRAGTWQVYLMWTDNVDSGWAKCTLKVGSGGGVKSGTKCVSKEASTGASDSASVQGGNINLGSSCKVTGFFKLGGCRVTITEGWIARDKTMISGVGRDCDDFIFQFNGIRR